MYNGTRGLVNSTIMRSRRTFHGDEIMTKRMFKWLISDELTETILRLGIVIAVLAVLILTTLWWSHPTSDINQKRLYLDAYKAIGIGFLIALLGTVIPNLILERRDNRESAERSRRAYSQAKTSVLYLPGKLAVLDFGAAMEVLENSHRKLHISETYGTELEDYLKWYGEKDIWTAQQYWELTAVRELLQTNADQWMGTTSSIGERTAMVEDAQATIRRLFGWKGAEWKEFVKKNGEEKADKRAKEEVNKLIKRYSGDESA